jgi:uncharacterized MAPEG superfamily protein
MTTELTLLAWSVALLIAQLLVAIAGGMTQFSPAALAGNREAALDGKGWVGRAQRAYRNMLEGLLPFAAVVLAAAAAGISNPATVLGAQLFFWARLAYAVVYVAGIPWLRTVVWTAGFAGILLILAQLL